MSCDGMGPALMRIQRIIMILIILNTCVQRIYQPEGEWVWLRCMLFEAQEIKVILGQFSEFMLLIAVGVKLTGHNDLSVAVANR